MTDKPAPKGIYLTTHAGTPIYVNEDGTFTCTYEGAEIKRTSLRELKRRIKGRAIEPIRFLTKFSLDWPDGRADAAFVAQDAYAPDVLHTDYGGFHRLRNDDVYHYDQAVIDKAIALTEQMDECRRQRAALVTKLRKVTLGDVMPKGENP